MKDIQILEDRSLMWEVEEGSLLIAGVPTTTGMPIDVEELSCYIRGIACTKVWLSKKVMRYVMRHYGKSYNHVNITIDWSKGYPLVTHIDFVRSARY